MKNRLWDEIPEALRAGWEPTEAGAAWRTLLGPLVPLDVLRMAVDLSEAEDVDALGDPIAMLEADNVFGYGVELAGASDETPILQMLTSTYWLSSIEGIGDLLMFHCPRVSETAEVVVWWHDTGQFSEPIAFDLPTALRVRDVAESYDPVEARAAQLAPTLGRWRVEGFPCPNGDSFEDDKDDLWDGDAWSALEYPPSRLARTAGRSRWLASAIVGLSLDAPSIVAQLDNVPDRAFDRAVEEIAPFTLLYWLFRSFFLDEQEFLDRTKALCVEHPARIVRDALSYLEDNADGDILQRSRTQACAIAAHARDPYPKQAELGPIALIRDDALSMPEPPQPSERPDFRAEKAEGFFWANTRIAVPHPDGVRWLVDGRFRPPGAPNDQSRELLIEWDAETKTATAFCDKKGWGLIEWGAYIDDSTLVVMNGTQIRLIKRDRLDPSRGDLMESINCGQADAVITDEGMLIAFGGTFLHGKLTPQKTTFVDVSSGNLDLVGHVEVALVALAQVDDTLIGETPDHGARYRLNGTALALAVAPEGLTFVRSAFQPNVPVPYGSLPSGSTGPLDQQFWNGTRHVLILRRTMDAPTASKTHFWNGDTVQPTSTEVEQVSGLGVRGASHYFVVNSTDAYDIDLVTGETTHLFERPPSCNGPVVLEHGFATVSEDCLAIYARDGAERGRIRVGDSAKIVCAFAGGRALALTTATSPLVVLRVGESSVSFLGAVAPQSGFESAQFVCHARPKYADMVFAQFGRDLFSLRGIEQALAAAARDVTDALPDEPWELGRITLSG